MCLDEEGAEEECKLFPKTTAVQGVSTHDGGRRQTLYSPGFKRQNNYNRFFCVYNVTLDCPGHKVNLASTERSLPFQADCRDYLAIYTDETNHKVCSDEFRYFKMTLNTNHFYAILWTDLRTSTGKFELEATCGDAILPTGTTSRPEEGSGHDLADV